MNSAKVLKHSKYLVFITTWVGIRSYHTYLCEYKRSLLPHFDSGASTSKINKENTQIDRNIISEKYSDKKNALSHTTVFDYLKATEYIWIGIASLRGLFSISASILASLGNIKAVKIVGTMSTALVFSELLLENKYLSELIKADAKTIESDSLFSPETRNLDFLSAISLATFVKLTVHNKYNQAYYNAQTIKYLVPFSLGSTLYFTIAALRTQNKELRLKSPGFLYDDLSSPSLSSADAEYDSAAQDKKTLCWLKCSSYYTTTLRAVLSTAATVRAWYEVFPKRYFKNIGFLILGLSFYEAVIDVIALKKEIKITTLDYRLNPKVVNSYPGIFYSRDDKDIDEQESSCNNSADNKAASFSSNIRK